MAVKHLTKENFAQELQVPGKHAVVDFYADWCGPCQGMKPILEDLSEECPEVAFNKVNVDEEASLALNYQIMSIPTLVVMHYGLFQGKAIGVQGKDAIREMLQGVL